MDITNVHNIRVPLRDLDHNYGGPPLRKFRDRDVRVGSQARSGRARADRFRGLGRAFKGLLARVADHFHFPQSRSARRFNRAHEAYSREADRLLDGLAAKGSEIDPAKLVDRLGRLKTHADEMAKHIAMEGPDGRKMTPEAAKSMGREQLKAWSASQARALRRELLAARVDVALDKVRNEGAHEYGELKKAFNGIDWETVEEGLDELREHQFREFEALNGQTRELAGIEREPDELIEEAVLASGGIVNDLRTIRDLVVTIDVKDTDPGDDIGADVRGILGALDDETDSDDDFSGWRGFGAKLSALGEMEGTPHQLERVLRDEVADLDRDDAARLHERLTEEVRNAGVSWKEIAFAAWFPDSGKKALQRIAETVFNKDFGVDNEDVDEELDNLRRGLKSLLTLGEVLEDRSASTGLFVWVEEIRDRVVNAHRDNTLDIPDFSDLESED